MRTASFVIAALFGYAAAGSPLYSAHQVKKAVLEAEINTLVDDLKAAKEEIRQFRSENAEEVQEHKQQVASRIRQLTDDFNTVNQNYASAFNYTVESIDVNHTTYGFPQLQTPTPAESSEIVDEWIGAVNSDFLNINDWVDLAHNDTEFHQALRNEFAEALEPSAANITRDIKEIVRTARTPAIVQAQPKAAEMLSPAQEIAQEQLRQDIQEAVNTTKAAWQTATQIGTQYNAQTAENVQQFLDDAQEIKEDADELEEDRREAIKNAIDHVNVTRGDGWAKIELTDKDDIVEDFQDIKQKQDELAEEEREAIEGLVERQKAIRSSSQAAADQALTPQTQKLADEIREIISDIKGFPRDEPTALTNIHINDKKMELAGKRLAAIRKDINEFARDYKLGEQVQKWAENHHVETRVNNAKAAIRREVKKLEHHNSIKEWAQEHNITGRAQNVQRIINSAFNVTNGAEIIDSAEFEQLSTEDVMLVSAFGVLIVAALATAANKFAPAKKADKFEFEVDQEMCAAPSQKENKKAIKKTLKNIMSKNNAKTTLIA